MARSDLKAWSTVVIPGTIQLRFSYLVPGYTTGVHPVERLMALPGNLTDPDTSPFVSNPGVTHSAKVPVPTMLGTVTRSGYTPSSTSA